MIALSEHLRNHGYDPTVETHTSIPGIWEKLRSLYALSIIDERENSFEYEDPDKFLDFNLPEEDFEVDMFMKGKLPSNTQSPPSSPPKELTRSPSPQGRKRKRADTATAKNRASTVDDTDDARTSPAQSPPPKPTRAGRSMNRSVGRAKAESSSRAPSKDTTMDEDEEAEETEEVGEDEEQEAEDDEGTPSPKASKAASKSKADLQTTRKSKRKR